MPDSPTVADMLLRHQLYVMGVRAGFAENAAAIVDDLDDVIRDTLARVLDRNLAELSKRDFNRLLSALRSNIGGAFETNLRTFFRDARLFTDIERQMYQGIFRADTGTRTAAPSVAKLWAQVRKGTVPATGQTLAQSAQALSNSTTAMVERLVRRAQADKLDSVDALRSIVGTSSRNFRDGALKRVGAWSRSFADTAIAHASATLNHEIASNYYKQYQWLSILDEATTEICTDRNLEIYEYGNGPVPPAHYGCRSEIVPFTGNSEDIPTSFASWLETQPGEFLSDLFKGGDASLDNVKVIQLDRFRDKIDFVLI